jgi:hypothetical protein
MLNRAKALQDLKDNLAKLSGFYPAKLEIQIKSELSLTDLLPEQTQALDYIKNLNNNKSNHKEIKNSFMISQNEIKLESKECQNNVNNVSLADKYISQLVEPLRHKLTTILNSAYNDEESDYAFNSLIALAKLFPYNQEIEPGIWRDPISLDDITSDSSDVIIFSQSAALLKPVAQLYYKNRNAFDEKDIPRDYFNNTLSIREMRSLLDQNVFPVVRLEFSHSMYIQAYFPEPSNPVPLPREPIFLFSLVGFLLALTLGYMITFSMLLFGFMTYILLLLVFLIEGSAHLLLILLPPLIIGLVDVVAKGSWDSFYSSFGLGLIVYSHIISLVIIGPLLLVAVGIITSANALMFTSLIKSIFYPMVAATAVLIGKAVLSFFADNIHLSDFNMPEISQGRNNWLSLGMSPVCIFVVLGVGTGLLVDGIIDIAAMICHRIQHPPQVPRPPQSPPTPRVRLAINEAPPSYSNFSRQQLIQRFRDYRDSSYEPIHDVVAESNGSGANHSNLNHSILFRRSFVIESEQPAPRMQMDLR